MEYKDSWLKKFKNRQLETLSVYLSHPIDEETLKEVSLLYIEYFLFSYGCSQHELKKLREYCFSYLPNTSLFNSASLDSSSRKYFLAALDQFVRENIDQEIFIRKFIAFIYEKSSKDQYTVSMLTNQQVAAPIYLEDIYVRNSKMALKRANIKSDVITLKKNKVLDEVRAGIDLKMVFFVAEYYPIYFGLLFTFFLFLLGQQIISPLVFIFFMGGLAYTAYTVQSTIKTAYSRSFRKAFEFTPGGEKFTHRIQQAIESFIDQASRSLNDLLKLKQLTQDNLHPIRRLNTRFPNDESEETASIVIDPQPVRFSQNLPWTHKKEKRRSMQVCSDVSGDREQQAKAIVWKVEGRDITYSDKEYNQQVVSLWTYGSLQFLNGKYYVNWNKEEIQTALEEVVRKKKVGVIYETLEQIGQIGHIVPPKQQGYVLCKHQKNLDGVRDQEYEVKIRDLGAYIKGRLFFKIISTSGEGEHKKYLLGAPKFVSK